MSTDTLQDKLFFSVHAPNEGGRGDVVLLHGLGSCGEDWGLQLPDLTRRYRVITPDLPGHGQTSPAVSALTVGAMAQAVSHLLEDLGIASAHVVGLSLGGAVALQWAIDRPDQVRSLTAVNTFARLSLARRGSLRMAGRTIFLLTGQMEWLGRWVAASLFPGADQAELREVAAVRIAGNSWRSYLEAALAVTRFDCRADLGKIGAPTLIVAGDRDTTVPLRPKLKLAERIPGARLEIISGSGHVTPIDATARFNALLLAFLDEVDKRERITAGSGRRP